MNPPQTKPYLRNALGQDVPMHLVKEVDRMRDELVQDLLSRFSHANQEIKKLKSHAVNEVEAFLDISAQRFGQDLGGKKGNVTLYSYDGKVKIVRTVNDNIVFDEGFAAAKELIDRYLDDIMQAVPGDVRKLIDRAFRPNKNGHISTSAVLGLRTLGINDERWIRAMHAISESVTVMSSKAYIRVYSKDENGNWQPVCVDFAAL
jgi:hypothetical protein